MFEGMTAAQIADYIRRAQQAYEKAFQDEKSAAGERAARIQNAIDSLTGLIGPEEGEPSLDSIRGVSRFSDEDIQGNAVLAIRLILQGMEQIALITRDLAETVA